MEGNDMSLDRITNILVAIPTRLFGSLDSVFLLAVRLWVGWDFFKSGLIKIGSWQTTLALFHSEYHTPVLPPDVAAVAGTAGELVFPALLFAGLAGRLSALGLFFVNVMAVVSYADVLLSEGFEAALAQHYLWGFALVVLIVFGPGKVSLDYLGTRYRGRPGVGITAHAV
jgi:putative oxidoreductase